MKKFFISSLAMLLLGISGVSADVEQKKETYDFEAENASTVFTGRSRITVAVEKDATLNSNVVSFTNASNAQNGYSFADYNFSSLVAKAQKVDVSFKMYDTAGGRGIITVGDAVKRGTTGGSSKTTYNAAGAIFRIGSDRDNAYINGTKLKLADMCDKWLQVDLSVNVSKSTMSYTVKTLDGETIKSETDVAYYQSADSCSQIDAFGYINNSKMLKIDDLSITATVDNSVVNQSYTVKYLFGETALKDPRTATGTVGATAGLSASDKEAIYLEDGSKKYIYESDDASKQTVAADGSTVVTVKFREANTYTYSVNGNSQSFYITGGYAFEGETVRVYYPAYYLAADSVLYGAKKLSSDGKGYYFDIVMTDDIVKDIAYDTEVADSVVYYIEGEKNIGLTACDNSNTQIRSSNGGSAYATEGAAPMTLNEWGYGMDMEPGKYKITSVACDAAGKSATATFYYTNGTDTIFTHKCDNINWDQKTSDELTFTEAATIYLAQGGNSKQGIDLFYIQKTGEYIPDYPARNTAKGQFGTACYPFSVAVEGADLYTATFNEDKTALVFTKVEGATEAGVPYVYCATADEQKFTASGARTKTPKNGTALTGVFTKTMISRGYVLDTKDGVQKFYAVVPDDVFAKNQNSWNSAEAKSVKGIASAQDGGLINITGTVCDAYNAYISGDPMSSDASYEINISGDDTPTAVNALNALITNSAKIYDANGRQLKSLQKGINIVNGTKVLVK